MNLDILCVIMLLLYQYNSNKMMAEIYLSGTTQIPVYKQIVEQVKQLIAANNLQPGERLPTVRDLARSLRINPGTVVRAYRELEREGIVIARCGGGTTVSARATDPQMSALRRSRLSNMVASNILEALSLGYSSEELEAAFSAHPARWREEREEEARASVSSDTAGGGDTILIVGSHDLALNLLLSRLKYSNPEVSVQVIYAGSLGGLIALQEGRAHLAGIHLLDEETGKYNYPYVKHILPGRSMAIVHLAYRIQGLMLAAGNPKNLEGLADLKRSDIAFVNRQRGSGTRVLLDSKLREIDILPSDIRGYERELDTHLAVATAIARGEVDVGLGIQAAASTCGIGFLPLFKERYDLVIPMENYRSGLLAPLLDIVRGEEFGKTVSEMGGYDIAETGATTFLG